MIRSVGARKSGTRPATGLLRPAERGARISAEARVRHRIMKANRIAATASALICGLAICQAGCVPRPAAPRPAPQAPVAEPAVTPELRASVEQRCGALIRPQLPEPNNIRALSVSHQVDHDRHVAKYCMEAGDGDGGFVRVEALCFYDMAGRVIQSPAVESNPSIVDAICSQ